MCYIYVVSLEECVSNLVMLHVYTNSELCIVLISQSVIYNEVTFIHVLLLILL
jgi:hypothetical protein